MRWRKLPDLSWKSWKDFFKKLRSATKDDAISYAQTRVRFRTGEIRVLESRETSNTRLRLTNQIGNCDCAPPVLSSGGKSDAVLRAAIGENALAAVHVIRGTKPPVCRAINSASDTVAVAGPIPAHGLALCGVERVRHEGEALSYGDIQYRRR